MLPTVVDFDFTIDIEKLLSVLHMDKDDELFDELCDLCEKAQAVIKPKAVYTLCSVEHTDTENITLINGIEFKSRIMKKNIENAHRAIAYVATCGTELESIDTTGDPLAEYWLDNIRLQAVGFAVSNAVSKIKSEFSLGKTATMNPGSLADFPISEQVKLFSLIDSPTKYIGVELSDSYLMRPLKSVSGVIFETEANYENCMLCPRLDCPNRRAEYNEALKQMYE